MNARYQKDTGPSGKTRRSASSARPKREAGAQSGSTSAKKSARKPARRQSLREAWKSMPSTPEMRRWRWIWGGLILLALVVAVAVGFVPGIKDNRNALAVGTVIYVAALGSAIYIDFAVIRKLRAKAIEEQKAAEKKSGKS
jgi:TRAP-type C4-dicarboxylate transport system permease large subunit